MPEPALTRRAAGSTAPPNIWRKTTLIPAILKPLTPAPQGAYTVMAPTQLTINNASSNPKRQAYIVLDLNSLIVRPSGQQIVASCQSAGDSNWRDT
jgi:hypothetical protein